MRQKAGRDMLDPPSLRVVQHPWSEGPVSFPVERAGPVLVSQLFPEAARAPCPRTLWGHVLELGPDPCVPAHLL